MNLKPVGEQVAAVVGASSGIGRETALRFAERGAKMILAARSEAGLRSLDDEIRGLGGQKREALIPSYGVGPADVSLPGQPAVSAVLGVPDGHRRTVECLG